jgi:carboxypeptidase family protein
MNLFKISLRALGMLVWLTVVLCSASAQYRASIQGVVTDPQGAAVSAATVTLKNLETGQILTATTNENGIYNFNGLPPSQYTLTVEKAGFKKNVQDNVGVIAEQANAVNVELQVGEVTQSVTVSGESTALIDTETSNLSGTVNSQQIQSLPSFGRDPFQLLQLAPGAFGDGAQAAGGGTSNLPGTTIGGSGTTDGIFKTENGGQITSGGARTGENNYTIDGVGMTSVSWGGTAVITPAEDSIKEVKIITDNYDAEYGRYRGAQVQIISQNGTNQYHGSAFFKAHRPGLDAFQRYNGYSNSVVKDDARFNDFGGTVGGPILHNKLFAFFSYETLRNNQAGITGGGWYETSAFRALAPSGSNAAKFLSFPGVAPNGGTQTDTLNGQALNCAFIGLTDPAHATATQPANCNEVTGGLNLGSPLTAALGTPDGGWTSATSPGTGGDGKGGANNLTSTPDIAFIQGILSPSTSSEAQYNGRLDFNATSRDLIAFSIYYEPTSSTTINGNGVREMNLFHHTVINEAETGLWDHTFSPTLVNEARINAAGWRWKDLQNNPNGPWGLPPIIFNNAFNGNPTIGTIVPNGFGIGAPGTFDQWTYGLKDVLTKVQNSHTLKMGVEVTRLLFVDNAPWNARPQYNFNNLWDFLNDAPQAESATFNPITGVPTDFRKDTRSTLYAFFLQDSYKIRSNLTVTLGLRWDYFGPISEKNGHLASVDLGTGADLISGIRVRLGGDLYSAQKGNFGPQLGFAWSPGGGIFGHEFHSRLVIRGGFGIAYNPLDEAISLNGRNNPPFLSGAGILTGNQVVYANSFPADVHSFGGYGSNPATIENFDATTNLPIAGPNFAPVDLTGYPSTWQTTYTYHFTLGAEYDLGHQWVASLGYQGSTTHHLTEQYNLMNVAGAAGFAFNPVVPGIDWYANDGSARFNALLLELKHRFSQSFQIDSQYRFSQTMDSGANNFSNGQYQYNLASNFGLSDYDVKNAFKVFGIWSPTIFHGSQSWLEKVAGGWSLSGILNAHSGFPFNPVYFEPDPLYAGSSGAGGSGAFRPVAYLGGFSPDFRSGTPTATGGQAFFTQPTITPGPAFACLFPNPPVASCPKGQLPLGPIPSAPIGRNLFRGPGYFDVDATLSKSFGLPKMRVLGENAKLEFRANFYNLFNKLNLTNIQTNIMDPHFGEAQNALGARTVEMQARFNF